ncbi:MAG: sulfatase-like hydrolase/transferase [Phycisphaeraceae bacterium]|nr:sulfatase-like hydrolase/transferase [Phycisphaeraceae bacterium]
MKPANILLIMCDQLRHDWLGYRGASHVATPHIDALAGRSRIMTQATCNSPLCAPSRISLASGMRPHRLGALNNHAYLPLSRPTWYQQFRNHGYHVGCCGKLDLAKPDGDLGRRGDRPLTYAWGFTEPHECEGKMHAGRGNPPNGPYTHWLKQRGLLETFTSNAARRRGGPTRALEPSALPVDAFHDVYIGKRSCDMLGKLQGDFPWYFFVSFVGPHDPFDPPVEFYQRFSDRPMPPAVPCEPEGRPSRYHREETATPDETTLARRLYTAYVACIDEQIGRILETLDERGERESTYIVFASDHGEMLGDHGRWTKNCHYEASVRVPLTVAGPGIEPGVSEALIELNDVNATLCELAGIPLLANVDARSFAPVLRNQTTEHRDFAMATHIGHGCVRTRQWKAIFGDDGCHELYDLANDPDERRNVLSDHPEAIQSLRQTYVREWAGSPRS